MNDLRQLINHLDHIDKGGDLNREIDPATGRIISKPLTENIARLIGAGIAGGGLALGANWLKDKFFSDNPDSSSPKSKKSNSVEPGNISDFSGPGNSKFVPINTPAGSTGNSVPNGKGHAGSNIDPNDDPEDPKTWPPGVKKAPDFGYLDSKGMWIPTPFNIRTEEGKFGRWLPNSPANLVGIPANQWTPFQQKVEKLERRNAFINSSQIEQHKPVKLPGGAPDVPGYQQVDASRFSTATGERIGPSDIPWVYAYKNGKNIILISPRLFYNMKPSIGRFYPGWGPQSGIRDNPSRQSTENGSVYVTASDFIVNDMILNVVVHASAPKVGASILQNLKI